MVVGGEPEQRVVEEVAADGDLTGGGEVGGGVRLGRRPRVGVPAEVDHLGRHRSDRQQPLVRHGLDGGELDVQRLVFGDGSGHGGPEHRLVDRAPQFEALGDVVLRAAGVEVLAEPHALLRLGQREGREVLYWHGESTIRASRGVAEDMGVRVGTGRAAPMRRWGVGMGPALGRLGAGAVACPPDRRAGWETGT